MPVAAGVVGDGRVRAGVVLAARDMAARRRRAAALDCAHHLQLVEADVSAVGFTPSGTVVAENIRDLQSWPAHVGGAYAAGLGLCSLPRPLVRAGQLRERTLDGGDPTCGHTCVARRRVQLGMPEQTRALMRTFYVIETVGSSE